MTIQLNDVVFDETSGPPTIPATPPGLARWDNSTGTLYVANGLVWVDVLGSTPAPVTPVRTKLTTTTDFYVSTTGSDANDGLTIGTPWQTIAFAINEIVTVYDFAGQTVNLNIADGTYNETGPTYFTGDVGGGLFNIKGNLGDPNFVVINFPDFSTGLGFQNSVAEINIQGVTFGAQALNNPLFLLFASNSQVNVDNVIFNLTDVNTAGIIYTESTNGVTNGDITFSGTGNTPVAILLSSHSTLNLGANTINFSTAINFTSAAFESRNNSLLDFTGTTVTNTGAATGRNFIVTENSHIETGTNDLTFLPPGTVDPVIADNSSYDDIFGLEYNTKIRERLTADRTYYVSPTGSDTNDGLTVGTPFQTIQKACDVVFQDNEVLGFSVVIQLADGTYPHPLPAFSARGNANIGGMGTQQTINRNAAYNGVEIRGNTGAPENVIIEINESNYGFYIDGHVSNLWINGMTFTRAAGSPGVAGAITINDHSKVYLSNLRFGEIINGTCVELFSGSYVQFFGTAHLSMDNSVGNYFSFITSEQSDCFLGITFTTEDATNISFASNVGLITLSSGSGLFDSFSTWTLGAGSTAPTRSVKLSTNSFLRYFPSALDFNRYPGTLTPEIDTTCVYGPYTVRDYVLTDTLSAPKTLFRYFDPIRHDYTVTAPQTITLSVSSGTSATNILNNQFIIKNNPTSTANITVNSTIITPGNEAEFIYNGTWVAKESLLIRELLTADRTYYVRTDGSDTNNGLTNNSGGAFLTIQRAIDVVHKEIDTQGFTVTIDVVDGTYPELFLLKPAVGGDALTPADIRILGNVGTPANVIANGFTASSCGYNTAWLVDGFTFNNNNPLIRIEDSYKITLGDTILDNNITQMIVERACLRYKNNSTITLADDLFSLLLVQDNAKVMADNNVTFDFTFNPTTVNTTIFVTDNSYVDLSGVTWANSGNVTAGVRFILSNFSRIFTNNQGLDFIPGAVNGTQDGTSQYDEFFKFGLTTGAPPTTGALPGHAKYDSGTDTLYIYDGATWQSH